MEEAADVGLMAGDMLSQPPCRPVLMLAGPVGQGQGQHTSRWGHQPAAEAADYHQYLQGHCNKQQLTAVGRECSHAAAWRHRCFQPGAAGRTMGMPILLLSSPPLRPGAIFFTASNGAAQIAEKAPHWGESVAYSSQSPSPQAAPPHGRRGMIVSGVQIMPGSGSWAASGPGCRYLYRLLCRYVKYVWVQTLWRRCSERRNLSAPVGAWLHCSPQGFCPRHIASLMSHMRSIYVSAGKIPLSAPFALHADLELC